MRSMDRKEFAPHMKFFAHTRIKRNTAFAMLLVWLFMLASGVANACFLEAPEPHSRVVMGPAGAPSPAHAELIAHPVDSAGHHDEPTSSKESCLKACNDGTNALLKASSAVDHDDPGPAQLVATLWTGPLTLVSASRRVDDWAIPVLGPPLRVRYSRLAL